MAQTQASRQAGQYVVNQPQPTTNKDRCELCGHFHTSERCPHINAKRDPKWDEWDKSLKARPLAIFNGGKPATN